jgi:hypothetical protein
MADVLFAILAKLMQTQGPGLVQAWTILCNRTFTTYHPEQHYMRGPGPKWREKHSGAPVA